MTSPKVRLNKWQRVFVNRSLNMAKIKAIGFDMDHTLALYKRDEFEALAFRKTLQKFISNGYPEELGTLAYDPNYVIRGLLVDRQRGNLLKVDGHKYVKLAFHGHRKLDKAERHTLYNSESFKAGDFLSVDTFFALSEVQLFVEIVEYMARNPNKIPKSYEEVYQDLRKFIDLSHRDGSIKSEVVQAPEKYFNLDKHLPETLIRLIEHDKTLFLLTNSDWKYTDRIMSYILSGKNDLYNKWRDFFHYVIVGAGKPGFFTGSQPFYHVDTNSAMLEMFNDELSTSEVYHGGNAELFQKHVGIRGDQILYIGDHIYGDIMRSKAKFNWRTVLVVEELDEELHALEKLDEVNQKLIDTFEDLEVADESCHMLNNRIHFHRHQMERSAKRGDKKKFEHLERDKEKLEEKLTEARQHRDEVRARLKQIILEKEKRVHPVWGELMKVGLDKSRFAQQVELYACLYTSRVSNLRFYSPAKSFLSPHEILPHDM